MAKSFTPNFNDKSYLRKEARDINVQDVLNAGYSLQQASQLLQGFTSDYIGKGPVAYYGGLEQAAQHMGLTPDTSKPPITYTKEYLDSIGMGSYAPNVNAILGGPAIDISRAYTLDA